MPLLRRKSVLAAKIESTSGTAESLSASDAAFNVFDLTMTPTIAMTPRPSQGSFSSLPAVPELYGWEAAPSAPKFTAAELAASRAGRRLSCLPADGPLPVASSRPSRKRQAATSRR